MVEINSDLKYSLKPIIMPSLVMIVKHLGKNLYEFYNWPTSGTKSGTFR
jgi:hypothetical protein